ncbi:MAG: ABC transporter permease, partial [Flavobacteriaceae bacterium]|nr:ABC transporter permease [Flavobacteriaceae bacterium]
LMGILVKRSAFAVGGILVWFFAESMFKGFLFWKFKDSDFNDIGDQVNQFMQFLPLESMSNLIKEPFTRLNAVQSVAKQVGEDLSKDFSVHFTDVIIVSAWTFIFIYLSYRLLQKRDL